MVNTETGWTKPQVDGVYWWRQGDHEPPDAVLVRGDVWYDFGDPEPTSVSLGKFLGPVTVSDAEQLSELRRVAQEAATWIEQSLFDRPHDEQGDSVVASLRAALNPQPEKETQ